MFHVKLYVLTDKTQEIHDLPDEVSKESMIQLLRNELLNPNVTFLELINNGESLFINKSKIIKLWIEEN